MRGDRLVGALIPVILVAALVAAGAWAGRIHAARKARVERAREQKLIAAAAVVEGDFEVVVRAVGRLEAVKSKPVMCEVTGRIIRLATNGVAVRKGDVIAVLDVPRMVRQLRDLEEQHRNALAEAKRKQRELAADVDKARIALEHAHKELERFQVSQKAELADKTSQREHDREELGVGRERLTRKSKLADEALLPKREVELATADIKAKEFGLERQSKELELAEAKQASELLDRQAAVDKAQADLVRAEATQQDEMRNAGVNLQIAEQQVKRVRDQLSKALVKSPADGILVLGDQWQMAGGPRTLEPGDQAWEGMQIATIPDLSRMRILLQLPQENARLVKPRQRVVVHVEAIPGHAFSGLVAEVSQTAKEGSLRGTGLPAGERTFETKVNLTNVGKAPLRPGMTAQARIIVERLPKAVSVPLECVFDQDDRKVVYLREGERFRPVQVELGPQNQDMVVIKRGLKTGQRVALRDLGERGLSPRAEPGTGVSGSQIPKHRIGGAGGPR